MVNNLFGYCIEAIEVWQLLDFLALVVTMGDLIGTHILAG